MNSRRAQRAASVIVLALAVLVALGLLGIAGSHATDRVLTQGVAEATELPEQRGG